MFTHDPELHIKIHKTVVRTRDLMVSLVARTPAMFCDRYHSTGSGGFFNESLSYSKDITANDNKEIHQIIKSLNRQNQVNIELEYPPVIWLLSGEDDGKYIVKDIAGGFVTIDTLDNIRAKAVKENAQVADKDGNSVQLGDIVINDDSTLASGTNKKTRKSKNSKARKAKAKKSKAKKSKAKKSKAKKAKKVKNKKK